MNVYYCETHEVGGTVRCHVCQAVNAERERIIKLLEERLRGVIAVGTDEKTWYWIDGMNDAIALIKGENE